MFRKLARPAVDRTPALLDGGQKLAFVFFEDHPGRRAAGKLLTKDEVRRVALNIAKPPDLLRSMTNGAGGIAAMWGRDRCRD